MRRAVLILDPTIPLLAIDAEMGPRTAGRVLRFSIR